MILRRRVRMCRQLDLGASAEVAEYLSNERAALTGVAAADRAGTGGVDQHE